MDESTGSVAEAATRRLHGAGHITLDLELDALRSPIVSLAVGGGAELPRTDVA